LSKNVNKIGNYSHPPPPTVLCRRLWLWGLGMWVGEQRLFSKIPI
jgi:hypothetical protein